MKRAFTLLEVMFSILILGTGLIAVSSLIPVAASIQRDTMDQVMAQSVTTNAENLLIVKGVGKAGISAMGAFTTVTNLSDVTVPPQLDALGYPLAERCYPQFFDGNGDGIPNNPATPEDDPNFLARQFYWRPLFIVDASGNWQTFVFIQRRINGVPKVVNSGTAFAGDLTVSATGVVASLTSDVANCTDWHAEVIGGRSTYFSFTLITTLPSLPALPLAPAVGVNDPGDPDAPPPNPPTPPLPLRSEYPPVPPSPDIGMK